MVIAAWSAIGTTIYLIVAAAAALAGVLTPVASSTTWILRTIGAVALAAVVALMSVQADRASRCLSSRALTGLRLTGIGIAWSELSEIDMHLLRLYEPSSPAISVVIHTPGIAASVTGAAVLSAELLKPTLTARRHR